ncbi:MAG: ABC transporter ATP-binding protein [Chloroflexota bacterium]|nr:MAG: ABC transporter ATP-binding protein [Chloroflexota bacterium]
MISTESASEATNPRARVPVAADSAEAALVIDHVSKTFTRDAGSLLARLRRLPPKKVVRAVDDITLTVEKGEIYGVLGSNGSGKSTLIRLVSTLLLPDAGTMSVFGHDVVRDDMAVRRLINRVSVDAAFFKKLSPWENLVYAARLYGMHAGEAREKSVAILQQLGIKRGRIDEPLENMSRGMQQKVAIARAFLTSPVLMLLDEPTTGLDPRSKRDVQEFVLGLRHDHAATIVLTTHDMLEADRLCDRLAIIDNGRIVALDTPDVLKERSLGEGRGGSLEDVFMHFTGRSLEDADYDENDDPSKE